jgi:hypothetical protein
VLKFVLKNMPIDICKHGTFFFSEIDLIPLLVTFVACLGLGLDYGMLIGIGVNLLFILYSSARPKVQVRNLTVSILLVKYQLCTWKYKDGIFAYSLMFKLIKNISLSCYRVLKIEDRSVLNFF